MNLEKRIMNVRKAIDKGKSKEVIALKFREYMTDYDNADKSVQDKQNHRDLFNDYCKYMYFCGDKN